MNPGWFGPKEPQRARLGIILDNPGSREDKGGTPVLCPTRQSLQQALWHAGISTSDIQVIFLFKCRPRGAYDRELAYQRFVPILEQQIRQGTTEALLGLGNTVIQGLLGSDATVKTLRGQIHRWADRPFCVSYHPLAVHRRPNLFDALAADLCQAGRMAGLATTGEIPKTSQ